MARGAVSQNGLKLRITTSFEPMTFAEINKVADRENPPLCCSHAVERLVEEAIKARKAKAQVAS